MRRLATFIAPLVLLLAALPATTAGAVTGAISTTTDPSLDNQSTGTPVLCLNGDPGTSGPNYVPAVNCNIYTAKQYVWISGLPISASLGAGTYFFAVLDPGGQHNPNDGAPGNLSSPVDGPWTNREFSVGSTGTITNVGSHVFDAANNLLNLAPYNDTSNPGGVYIAAVCAVPSSPSTTPAPGVTPKDCKYDAFKVSTTGTGPQNFDLLVSKDATPSYTRTYAWTINKAVDKTEVDTTAGASATFNYTVKVGETSSDSNVQVTGTISVLNPNAFDFTGANVTDSIDFSGNCSVPTGSSATVPANSMATFPYTCAYGSTVPTGPGTNTATATWTDNNTPTHTATGTATFAFDGPTTQVDPTVTVTDPLDAALPASLTAPISPNPTIYNYSRIVTALSGTCNTYDNTATFTATDNSNVTGSSSQTVKVCGGTDLTVTKTATPSYTYGITKTADQTSPDKVSGPSTLSYKVVVTESGWQVTGNITVKNPNDWEDVSVNLADVVSDSGATCSITGGITQTVPHGGSIAPSYTCSFSPAPTAAGGSNTATATWSASTSFTSDGSASSGPVSYTFAPLTVTDAFNGANPGKTLGTISTPAASTTYSDSYPVTPTAGTCTTYPNSATAADGTASQTANASVQVCVGKELTVTKTAAPSYIYGIQKTANQTSPVEAAGSTTLGYKIVVTESGWQVSGNITVTNPNDWEPVSVNLADALSDAKGSCLISGGNTQTVAVSSSISPSYTCSFSSAPTAASGTNTATATYSASTPLGKASGSATYAFASLTVTDTFNGGTPKTLGTIAGNIASTPFTDSYTVTPTGGTCVVYPNTATAKDGTTSQSSSASVTVCNTRTGALTMGFWQNKNGQGIINLGASTAGVCNSGTWLRQYAPFQDLSASATCGSVGSTSSTTVVGYVYNIIKAANASGAAMNAMLKAQMLSTALDVYFSDPSLGGNKISAAAPIGGVNIDLTKVCKLIDNTTAGTATCATPLSYENVSSAFGNPVGSKLTVSQMLTYAASQSNVGGITWYANNKATQQLAKDAFDAINNQLALIAP